MRTRDPEKQTLGVSGSLLCGRCVVACALLAAAGAAALQARWSSSSAGSVAQPSSATAALTSASGEARNGSSPAAVVDSAPASSTSSASSLAVGSPGTVETAAPGAPAVVSPGTEETAAPGAPAVAPVPLGTGAATSAAEATVALRAKDELVALIGLAQNDCARQTEDVPIRTGGGFASKFQLAAGLFAAALRRGRAVRFVGHWAGYSEIEPCKEAVGEQVYKDKGSFTCFFEPESLCPSGGSSKEEADAAFARLAQAGETDYGHLYKAVEAYMFRPNAVTMAEFGKREALLGLLGDQSDGMLVGIHERRGDKIQDTYNRYYTSMEYAQVVAASVTNSDSSHAVGEQLCAVYVASDSSRALKDLRAILDGVSMGTCKFRVVGQNASVTQQAMDSHKFDHWGENQGMAGKVGLLKSSDAMAATLEILFDIYVLSLADLLVGTLTSQIGRMAAGLRRLSSGGRAVALDYRNLASVAGMGASDGIPSPKEEGWEPAPATEHVSLRDPAARDQNEWVTAVGAVQRDCARQEEELALPESGSLALRLQLLAAQMAAALQRGHAIRISGQLGGYTDNARCKEEVAPQVFQSNGGWACFFVLERFCPAGGQQKASEGERSAADAAVTLLQGIDTRRAAEAAQAYLFHLNEWTRASILKRSFLTRLDEDAFSSGDEVLIGVDIRGGEQQPGSGAPQPGAPRPPREYADAVRAWAEGALRKPAETSAKTSCVVYVASDGDQALAELKGLLDKKETGTCHFRVVGLEGFFAHSHVNGNYPQISEGRDVAVGILFDARVLAGAAALFSARSSQVGRLAAALRRAGAELPQGAGSCFALDYLDTAAGNQPADAEGWSQPPVLPAAGSN